ncbi:MAG TPA: dolichyl-phosphate beta-glucosyltransferase [Candidatus Dormibacteraeota bacterium]|nr:dolichyl-phosphate beta-glucosyltransferase [Candidatus Dormibacteraeota bacterium]
MELSVVVPCFNEAARLPSSLEQAEAYLELRGPAFELLLVDDGSSDKTAELIREAASQNKDVRAVLMPANRGKGRAVAEGVARSRGELVLISDADFSAPIEEMAKLETAIASGADLAIGSRAKRGAREVDQPLHRRLMGKSFNLLVQGLLLPGIWDTQCGFKLFKGDVARDLFGRLRTEGFAYDVEILVLARRSGYQISEVPVRWINSSTSRVETVRHSRQMLTDVLHIRLGR